MSGLKRKRLSKGVFNNIEVATIATDVKRRSEKNKGTMVLASRSNLMLLVARWRQKSLPKSVITSRASVLLIKAVVPCRGCPRSLVVLANNSVFQQNRCSVTISLKNRAFDRKHWENALRKRSPQVPMDRHVRVLTCEQALSLGERSEPRENVRASGETSPHACHSCMYFSRYPPNGELARRLLACVAGTRK